jgi:hypothetical protein
MLALKSGISLESTDLAKTNAYALKLTGTEYITLDEAADEFDDTKGSFSIWTQLSAMSSNGHIMKIVVDTNNFIQIFFNNATQEIKAAYKGGGATTRVITFDASSLEGDGKWHHLLFTWQTASNRLSLSLDGEEQAYQTSALGAWVGTPTLFDIGQNTAGGNYYKGFVSEVALFDEVKAAANVYGASVNNRVVNLTGQSGLVGYWKFNEGRGAVALDSSGKGNPGSIVNTPDWVTDTPK